MLGESWAWIMDLQGKSKVFEPLISQDSPRCLDVSVTFILIRSHLRVGNNQ